MGLKQSVLWQLDRLTYSTSGIPPPTTGRPESWQPPLNVTQCYTMDKDCTSGGHFQPRRNAYSDGALLHMRR